MILIVVSYIIIFCYTLGKSIFFRFFVYCSPLAIFKTLISCYIEEHSRKAQTLWRCKFVQPASL